MLYPPELRGRIANSITYAGRFVQLAAFSARLCPHCARQLRGGIVQASRGVGSRSKNPVRTLLSLSIGIFGRIVSLLASMPRVKARFSVASSRLMVAFDAFSVCRLALYLRTFRMAVFKKTVTAYRCERCDYEWMPRFADADLPTVCANRARKSPAWKLPNCSPRHSPPPA